ncbi:Hypothetical protein RG1141_CH07590 [Neorhizobium galegae bv. officinalis bv. officinalis str. HAMBI 1141]|uniref:Uncharacterized protein n=1 Tax=Neorhizobium galegae bv. officinalis bv. officinalis str. HAMBI 1141 TaxID=1028801 RepID=A0A068T4U7_NEOGA|nr:Hypothetical protein RG1141_CH07590 [Neorhizobium galegae bv. officinalis bv. officinalis str. HAMBI 1141]
MEKHDQSVFFKTNSRSAALEQMASNRDQKIFDVAPIDGRRHRILKYGDKRLALLAVHASTLMHASRFCKQSTYLAGTAFR